MDWALGLYIRAFAYKYNLQIPVGPLELHCSRVPMDFDTSLCQSFFQNWSRLDLINFADFIGLRGRFFSLTPQDKIRIALAFMYKATLFTMSDIMLPMTYMAWDSILPLVSLTKDSAVWVLTTAQQFPLRRTLTLTKDMSIVAIQAVFEALGLGFMGSLRFSRDILTLVLWGTLNGACAVTQSAVDWLVTAATQTDWKAVGTYIAESVIGGSYKTYQAGTWTAEAVVKGLAALWNALVAAIREVVTQVTEDNFRRVRDLYDSLKAAVTAVNTAMTASVKSVAGAVGKVTAFSAHALWKLAGFMKQLGLTGLQVAEAVIQQGFWLTHTSIKLTGNAMAATRDQVKNGLAQFYQAVLALYEEHAAEWTMERLRDLEDLTNRFADAFRERGPDFLALAALVVGTSLFSLMGFQAVRFLIFSSGQLMKIAWQWIWYSVGINWSAFISFATPFAAALGFLLSTSTALKLLRLLTPFLLEAGKQAVTGARCRLQSVFWACVQLMRWTFTQEDEFAKDLQNVINRMFDEHEASGDEALVPVARRVSMRSELNRAFEEAMGDAKQRQEEDNRQLQVVMQMGFGPPAAVGEDEDQKGAKRRTQAYDYELVTRIGALHFPQEVLVQALSEAFAASPICRDPPLHEPVYEAFPERGDTDQDQEEAIQICEQVMNDPRLGNFRPLRSKRQWRQWTILHHPDKNPATSQDEEMFDFFKQVLSCGTEYGDVIFSEE